MLVGRSESLLLHINFLMEILEQPNFIFGRVSFHEAFITAWNRKGQFFKPRVPF